MKHWERDLFPLRSSFLHRLHLELCRIRSNLHIRPIQRPPAAEDPLLGSVDPASDGLQLDQLALGGQQSMLCESMRMPAPKNGYVNGIHSWPCTCFRICHPLAETV